MCIRDSVYGYISGMPCHGGIFASGGSPSTAFVALFEPTIEDDGILTVPLGAIISSDAVLGEFSFGYDTTLLEFLDASLSEWTDSLDLYYDSEGGAYPWCHLFGT